MQNTLYINNFISENFQRVSVLYSSYFVRYTPLFIFARSAPGLLSTRTFWPPDFGAPGLKGTRTLGHPDFGELGLWGTRTLGHPDFGAPGL